MWLIDIESMTLKSFEGTIPPYAILSHTWKKNELTFRDFQRGWEAAQKIKGSQKIEYTCDQAKRDNLQYVWADVCCIDKSSSAELSEAINSMYQWYKESKVCYAYLDDVRHNDFDKDFSMSRWFTRGWTLQELLAPPKVDFYGRNWTPLGSKQNLMDRLAKITGIDQESLEGNLQNVSVAQRMSWAANRHTTRLEDEAYCLLGIFNCNMPLLYGEGKQAFVRLQKEILENSNDQSLFSWGIRPALQSIESDHIIFDERETHPNAVSLVGSWHLDLVEKYSAQNLWQINSAPYLTSMFAPSPCCFQHCGNIVPIKAWLGNIVPHPTFHAKELRLNLPIIECGIGRSEHAIAVLGCYDRLTQLVISVVCVWHSPGKAARLIEPLGIPIRQTVLKNYWILHSHLRWVSFVDEQPQLPVGIRVIINDNSALTQGYKLHYFSCSHGRQSCPCHPKLLAHAPRTYGHRAIFLYNSLDLPPFWVLVGKYETKILESNIEAPILASRTLLRAGFFSNDDGVRFHQEKCDSVNDIDVDIFSNQGVVNFDFNKAARDNSVNQPWTIKRLIGICASGDNNEELRDWHREVEVLDQSCQVSIMANLERSSFPEFDDCIVEEALTINICRNLGQRSLNL
jgi:hypothetical protein